MRYMGLIKRIIPFALTFAAGLFLASFFVSIGLPGERWRGERRVHKMRQMQQLRSENEELREKCRQLRSENEELRRTATLNFDGDLELSVPPPTLDHHPPHPPKRDPKKYSVYGDVR